MRREQIFCDCCKNEFVENAWFNTSSPFEVQVYTPSCNPLGYIDESPGYQAVKLTFKDTCPDCARKLAQSIADCIMRIRGQKEVLPK